MPSKRVNIVVVGAGVSGLVATLSAVESGADVTLISSGEARRSHGASMRVGLNAVLPSLAQKDSIEKHIEDTYSSGGSLAHRDAVIEVCKIAPRLIGLLERMGVSFDRTHEGYFDLASIYGSSFPRSRFSGLSTGQSLLSVLDGQLRRFVENGRVRILSGKEFISPIVDDEGRCRGVITADVKNTRIEGLAADSVIMCTGGYHGIFGSSTASRYSNGSAIIACFMRGAVFANPEFSSIHPFTIALGSKRIPIPESIIADDIDIWVFNDGKKDFFLGDLVDSENPYTMDDISRTVWRALESSSSNSVSVDLTHLDWNSLSERFPRLLDICGIVGLDPMDDPISVEPAPYYSLGGLWVNNDHATSMDGLFAAGSCACRYHGAGVLAGNELLSSLHGALIAGKSAIHLAKGSEVPASLIETAIKNEEDAIAEMTSRVRNDVNAHSVELELGKMLSASAAISKDDDELTDAASRIGEMKELVKTVAPLDSAQWANDEISALRNVGRELVLAGMIVDASRNRCESRGAHYKPATPDRDDDKWRVTTKVTYVQGLPSFDYSEGVSDE